eukprot:6720223-Pyramimonas_sp.AAC.2
METRAKYDTKLAREMPPYVCSYVGVGSTVSLRVRVRKARKKSYLRVSRTLQLGLKASCSREQIREGVGVGKQGKQGTDHECTVPLMSLIPSSLIPSCLKRALPP